MAPQTLTLNLGARAPNRKPPAKPPERPAVLFCSTFQEIYGLGFGPKEDPILLLTSGLSWTQILLLQQVVYSGRRFVFRGGASDFKWKVRMGPLNGQL